MRRTRLCGASTEESTHHVHVHVQHCCTCTLYSLRTSTCTCRTRTRTEDVDVNGSADLADAVLDETRPLAAICARHAEHNDLRDAHHAVRDRRHEEEALAARVAGHIGQVLANVVLRVRKLASEHRPTAASACPADRSGADSATGIGATRRQTHECFEVAHQCDMHRHTL